MPSLLRTPTGWTGPLLAGAACALAACSTPEGPAASPTSLPPTPPPLRTSTPRPQPTAAATASPASTAAAPTATLPPVGPEYEPGFNPLTGLPIGDASVLQRNPLVVAITIFPPSARPQAGLMQASHVWETSIGEGMTRFLAVYYGDYLETLEAAHAARSDADPYQFVIGPVRSGRIAFEEIKSVLPEAQLVIRNASGDVRPRLSEVVVLDPLDPSDVNSAGLRMVDVERLVKNEARPEDYAGLAFSPVPPAGGEDGSSLRLIYNVYNDVAWAYEPEQGAYLRYQNVLEPGGELLPATDRLSGRQLAAENVLVLFARHRFENLAATILDIELAFIHRGNGFLFRDGKRYPIHWGTTGGRLRIEDADGNPVPLKPGRSYFQVVSYQSTWDEQERLLRFHSPPLPTLTPTPTFSQTPTPTATPSPTASSTATPSATP